MQEQANAGDRKPNRMFHFLDGTIVDFAKVAWTSKKTKVGEDVWEWKIHFDSGEALTVREEEGDDLNEEFTDEWERFIS